MKLLSTGAVVVWAVALQPTLIYVEMGIVISLIIACLYALWLCYDLQKDINDYLKNRHK